MQVAVLGAGAIGLGSAALLVREGHRAVLWSPSLVTRSGEAELTAKGAVEGSFAVGVAADVAAAAGADAVLLAVPGWAHRAVMDQLAPHVAEGQAIIVSSHASLGGLYLHRLLAARGCGGAAPVIAWGTTVVTGRRTGSFPGTLACTVSNVRTRVDAAAVPAAETGRALDLCRALFGDRFVERDGLLAIQLSNVNPQNHLAMALCNLTRIERGEDWGNYWGITQAVGRLMEALDRERLALAERFGVVVRTVREHFHLSFQVPMGPVAEQAAAVDARGNAPLGPKSLDTRYALEDVPYGIAVTEALGRIAGVPTPLHTAGVEMFSALYGRDFRRENALLPALGLEGMDAAGLVRATRGSGA